MFTKTQRACLGLFFLDPTDESTTMVWIWVWNNFWHVIPKLQQHHGHQLARYNQRKWQYIGIVIAG